MLGSPPEVPFLQVNHLHLFSDLILNIYNFID